MVFDDLWKCNFTKKDLYFISKLQILSFRNRKCVLAHVVSTETCLQLLIKWTWWHNFLLGTSKYFWMHLFILKELLAYFLSSFLTDSLFLYWMFNWVILDNFQSYFRFITLVKCFNSLSTPSLTYNGFGALLSFFLTSEGSLSLVLPTRLLEALEDTLWMSLRCWPGLAPLSPSSSEGDYLLRVAQTHRQIYWRFLGFF